MPTKRSSRLLSFCCSALLALSAAAPISLPVVAEEVAVRSDHPDHYTVVKGDTLWDISGRFLEKPWLWPEVWQVNPQIQNPHLIYPGDVVSLIYVDGKPRLVFGRAGVDKLSPRVRAEPLEGAIPTIPLALIQPFLTRGRVVSAAELDAAGYVLEHAGEHIITGKGDRVYARHLPGEATPRVRYGVYQPGDAYTDPDTGEHLGYEALFIADAEVSRSGDPATLKLTSSTREVNRGDRVLVADDQVYEPYFQPRAPEQPVTGRIIAVMDGVSQIGQHQVVVLNRGTRDGLVPGHVLAIDQAGATVKDVYAKSAVSASQSVRERSSLHDRFGGELHGEPVTLPDEEAGVLLVFRPFERVSYALVMRATRAIHVLDKVRNP